MLKCVRAMKALWSGVDSDLVSLRRTATAQMTVNSDLVNRIQSYRWHRATLGNGVDVP